MNQVISFSGGRTSAYMTLEVLKLHPDAEVIYMDTGAEHPKTYEFIRNFANHFCVNITCLRVIPNPEMRKASTYELLSVEDIGPDLEPWRKMLRKYGHPYVGGAFCTDRMKTTPFTKYCDEKYGKGNYERWLGIRVDEPNRLGNRGPGFHYLADISDFEKQDVIEWWSGQDFDLGIQEHLGNCVFCIKKSLQKVALATKDEPDLANQFIDAIYGETARRKGLPRMYRGKNTLPGVIALFGDTGRDELASRMKSMRQYDTGSCSESCEAFSDFSPSLVDKINVVAGSTVATPRVSTEMHDNGSATLTFSSGDLVRYFYALRKGDYYYLTEIKKGGPAGKGRVNSIQMAEFSVFNICTMSNRYITGFDGDSPIL